MNDHELVKTCLQEICNKSGYDHFPRLTQREMEFLCDDIEEKTNILISLSTIKRLINGQFSRLPQVATLNAITAYLGYENWQDFRVKKKNGLSLNGNGNGHENGNGHTVTAKPAKRKIPYKIIGIGLAAALVIVLIAFGKFTAGKRTDFSSVPFSAEKTTSNKIPNTVVFHYNIDDLEGDSFFIQQSWDVDRRVRIYKKNYTLTDIYYEPGYHNARLIVNDKIIKMIPVSIPTDKWIFYAREHAPNTFPKYIMTGTPFKNGALQLNKEELVNSNINYQLDQRYVYSFFPSKFTAECDNFTLTARVRMNDLRNNTCPFIMYEVFCQNYFMYFSTTPPGCTSTISAQFSNLELNGKTSDLSAFGHSVTDWQEVKMTVKNKQVNIYINQKEVYSGAYTKTAGMITGLGFISNGLCEVDKVRLEGLNAEVVYESEFNN